MTIHEIIEPAFADVAYPGDERIAEHENCPECNAVRAHFRGASWRGHTVEELQQYQSALSLFTPEALQYFLPAFMLVSLGAWRQADNIPSSILYQCLPPGPDTNEGLEEYWRERFEILTRPQREAVAEFLKEWANSDCPFVDAYAGDIPRAIELLLHTDPAS